MTNKEKFKKVFNQEPDDTICPVYCSDADGLKCPNFGNIRWCEAGDWWNEEYKAESEDNNG